MIYKYNSKEYRIPDEVIDDMMEKLDCSLAEACEGYLFDHDLIKSEEEEKITEKVKKSGISRTIHQAKGEKKERKPREKKENPLKQGIISVIYASLIEEFAERGTISITNNEKYIDFSIDGREFTVNLVEHRKKKDK